MLVQGTTSSTLSLHKGKGDHGNGWRRSRYIRIWRKFYHTTTTTTTTMNQGYGWQSIATGAAADVMGIAIDATGLGTAWKVGKGLVSLAGKTIGGFLAWERRNSD